MKGKLLLLLSAAFSCVFAVSSYAGTLTKDEKGFRYTLDDGTSPVGWYQEDENSPWYYLQADGYARLGWVRYRGKSYYLRFNNAEMIADRTMTLDGHIYQFNHDGVAIRLPDQYEGWMRDDVTWYYRFSNGTCAIGWRTIDGERYHFDKNGYMETGLITDQDKIYYLSESGAMVHDTQVTVDGKLYQFDSEGAGTEIWPYKEVTTDIPDSEKTEFRKSVDAMADSILAGLINDSMSRQQKAEAIYAWVRGNFSYRGSSATRDWVEEAYQGIRRRHGDCYTYFAVSQLLLVRAGIPCMEVIRYTDNGHYWNLVQMDDGSWYHFDTTPRSAGGYFCLWTDAQMAAYSAAHKGCFAFDRSLYPPTP